MLTVLSLVTSVKDYIEIAHKLVETQASSSLLSNGVESTTLISGIKDYTELGSILTYVVLSIKEFLTSFFTLSWLKNIWSLPLIVPDIASAMISEISVLDSYFTNAFSFLETGLSTSNLNATLATSQQNSFLYGFEKFVIGFLNSLFLFLPTSTSHLITLRRFVMQGLEAGYMAGLGTIAGNFLWLASIILGWRFIVIPWLSLDIFRYVLGFVLLVKYLWDSSKELNKTSTRTTLENNTKIKMFALNFLLALTEQTSIYPFISNISFGAEGSILEGFSGTIFQSESSLQFFAIHGCYLLGILLGSFSLLQFTVWFWENPAYSIYMWMVSSYKVTTSSYYKVLNFVFLYLTMLCAISSIPYFGLDYTVTNPLGLIPQDRMIDQKLATANGPGDKILQETAFLGVNPTDKNSRIRDGVHARRERWKERLMKYQAVDASLYDQGTYDILTIEDLNYGFDRFWLRRKMRNHQIRFRLFPGPWMRSLKKQLNKPGFTGPRVEFFRILFEQYYHPSFHATNAKKGIGGSGKKTLKQQDSKQLLGNTGLSLLTAQQSVLLEQNRNTGPLNEENGLPASLANAKHHKSLYTTAQSKENKFKTKKDLITTQQYSALRKFARNFSNRTNVATLSNTNAAVLNTLNTNGFAKAKPNTFTVYSKSLKSLFNKIDSEYSKEKLNLFRNISKNLLMPSSQNNNISITNSKTPVWGQANLQNGNLTQNQASFITKTLKQSLKNTNIRKKLSKKDRLLLIYKTNLLQNNNLTNANTLGNTVTAVAQTNVLNNTNPYLQPLNFYFQKDQAFKRKLKYYSTSVTRSLTVGNNAPYFKTMLKRAFYYHKPSLRLKRTLFTAAMRRGFRKKSINPKKLLPAQTTTTLDLQSKQVKNTDATSTQFPGFQSENSATIYPATTSYSVLGKRASRYRYQIYKDVLQHWYYTPFNRLLLKFDIDSFINRQPKTHFLTKKEERLLHLRRSLLADHYNTLRWYTYMQHYRTMKSRIGGSKSFANTAYNQQFQGTFKKIRHLFSITPSQGDMSVLKFDQVLFNAQQGFNANSYLQTDNRVLENANSKQKANKFNSSNPTGIIHEELSVLLKQNRKPTMGSLTIDFALAKPNKANINSASKKLPEDLIEQSLGITGQYVSAEQSEKMLKLQEYINQKNYAEITKLLYLTNNQDGINSTALSDQSNTNLLGLQSQTNGLQVNQEQQTKQILFQLLKECKRRLNDQAFLKNYVNHRIDKREQRNRETEKELKMSLDNLKTWLSPISIYNATNLQSNNTTGLNKALNEGVYVLNNINPAVSAKTILLSNTKPLKFKELSSVNSSFNAAKNISIQVEQAKITETLNSLKSLSEGLKVKLENKEIKTNKLKLAQNLKSVKNLINNVLKPVTFVYNKLLVKRSEKNLEWWRKKQRVMAKRQTARKKQRIKTLETNIEQINKKQVELAKSDIIDSQFSNWLDSSNNLLLLKSTDLSVLQKQNRKSRSNLTTPTNLEVLRKKLDNTDSSMAGSGLNIKPLQNSGFSKIFEKLFIKKFRKKPSSKGRRFRVFTSSAGGARGFAYIKKPKKAINVLTLGDLSGNSINFDNLTPNLVTQDANKKALLKEVKAKLTSLTTQSLVSNSTGLVGDKNLKNLKNLLIQTNIKQSPIKKNTLAKRTIKRRKRHKVTRNLQRYRKRQLQGIGKLRMLSKKIKRIEATHELRNWWWNYYLPNYINTQGFKAQLLQNTANAKNSKALKTSEVTNSTTFGFAKAKPLVTPNYKPLSTNKALDIASKYNGNPNSLLASESNVFSTSGSVLLKQNRKQPEFENQALQTNGFAKAKPNSNSTQSQTVESNKTLNIVDQIYIDLLTSGAQNNSNDLNSVKTLYTTTTVPFYAGWDESLRKFVVTNRLLSRRNTGFEVSFNSIFNSNKQALNSTQTATVEFTKAPLQGLNEGSFLYLQNAEQLPFNAYNIDQFIPNNQSFYAPLGWKRFEFRHSLLKNWLNNIYGFANAKPSVKENTYQQQGSFSQNIFLNKNNLSNIEFFNNTVTSFNKAKSTKALQNRRIKKRYKLLKQTPIQLMYLPSGALLTEVLPSHYISVFDKQYRFPRNRYLKRNLLKSTNTVGFANAQPFRAQSGQSYTKDLTVLEFSNNLKNGDKGQPGITTGQTSVLLKQNRNDFTLRKRIKPRRKYHKKRFTKKESLIFPRRLKFGTSTNDFALAKPTLESSTETSFKYKEMFRLRPSSTSKQNIVKSKSKKRVPKANPIRLRQLRRREFQQVYKPLLRFQPRYGGFVWPGDYLRLDVIPMPKLESLPKTQNSKDQSSGISNKVQLGLLGRSPIAQSASPVATKINVQPVGLLPRQYLIQKHNLKVLKKKLALSLI
jgi:hypothetical protein